MARRVDQDLDVTTHDSRRAEATARVGGLDRRQPAAERLVGAMRVDVADAVVAALPPDEPHPLRLAAGTMVGKGNF